MSNINCVVSCGKIAKAVAKGLTFFNEPRLVLNKRSKEINLYPKRRAVEQHTFAN